MRRVAMALGVMAAVLFVAGVSAQNKKDFTGKWTIDAEKSGGTQANAGGGARQGRGGGGGASDFTVRMDAKTMVVITNRNGTESTVTYNLDGSDSKNTAARGGGGGEEISNAKWDGDKLVITTKLANGTRTTSYWMDGTDLVRESVQPGRDGAPGTPARSYFKKAS